MSTGAECFFTEKERGKWHYNLQRWPYGEWPEFDEYGPFKTFGEAHRHLHNHNANPGGYSVNALPDCPHDLLIKREHDNKYPFECDRCGKIIEANEHEKTKT